MPGDTTGAGDVFVRDRQTGTTSCISLSSTGVQGNDYSNRPVISLDGNTVGFTSNASNLVACDTNVALDAFVRAR